MKPFRERRRDTLFECGVALVDAIVSRNDRDYFYGTFWGYFPLSFESIYSEQPAELFSRKMERIYKEEIESLIKK